MPFQLPVAAAVASALHLLLFKTGENMSKPTKMKKVIWAVDASPSGKKLQFATFKSLARLTAGSGAVIEPVTVVSPDQLRVPTSAFEKQSRGILLGAETLLKKWVKELKNPRLTAPTLLLQKKLSSSQTIQELLQYAEKSGASLIGVGTHTKKTWERLLVGSFAETMILNSRVPLFIVNPKTAPTKKISKIFFPTDFAPGSEAAFDALLATAKNLKAKVVLYYKFEYILPETYATISSTPQYRSYFNADKEHHAKTARLWIAKADANGVKAEVILDDKPFFVTEGILEKAKKVKADIIAMASHSNLFEATMLGSTTRQVIRSSRLPVWVIHTPAKRGRLGSSISRGVAFSARG